MFIGYSYEIDSQHLILKFKVFQISRALANADRDYII